MPSESFAIATPAGFVGIGFTAEITCALEHCFLDRNGYDSSSAGTPRALTSGRTARRSPARLNHLGHQGLLLRGIGGQWGLVELQQLAVRIATRYTTSNFLWTKLGNALRSRNVAPHNYERADEARMHLLALDESSRA